jgi:hypothetical protein
MGITITVVLPEVPIQGLEELINNVGQISKACAKYAVLKTTRVSPDAVTGTDSL